jgi:hypothetical protein
MLTCTGFLPISVAQRFTFRVFGVFRGSEIRFLPPSLDFEALNL